EPMSVGSADPGGVGDIREREVAVVPQQNVFDWADPLRLTIHPDLFRLVAAENVVGREVPVTVSGQVEIEVAVIVVIQEGATGGPAGPVDPGRFTDIAKRAVAVIEEKHIRAVVAQEDVLVAVVVDIGGENPMTEARDSEPRSVRCLMKSPTSVAPVETIGAG